MAELTLGFYLARPLVPAATAIASELGRRLGIAVDFDPDASDTERRRAIDRGEPGLTWMCGLETLLQIDEGNELEIVAAPVFAGRDGPVYHSVVVVREGDRARSLGDLDGSVLAINETRSWSGHHALRSLFVEEGLADLRFASVRVTGGHSASIDALVEGTADVAAIDDTVWADRAAMDPAVSSLRVIGRTPNWPAPPFSLAGSIDPALRSGLRAALSDLSLPGLTPVLRRIVPAANADYEPIRAGYATSLTLPW